MRDISRSLSGMSKATHTANLQQKFANEQQVLANKLGQQRKNLEKSVATSNKAVQARNDLYQKQQMLQSKLAGAQAAQTLNAEQHERTMQQLGQQRLATTEAMTAKQAELAAAQKAAAFESYPSVNAANKSALAARTAEVRDLEAQMKQLDVAETQAMKQFEGDTNAATAAQSRLHAAIDGTSGAIERQTALNTEAGAAMSGSQNNIKSIESQMAAAEAQQARLLPLTQRADRLTKAKSHFGTLSGLGTQSMFVGGIGLGIAGLAANSAAQVQRQSTLAATQAGNNIATVGEKAKGIMKLVMDEMKQFPSTASDMEKSIYDIFSGTNIQSLAKGKQMLTLMNKAAVAGQTDTQTATNATITLMNAFGLKTSQVPKALNNMFASVRYGRMTFEDFAGSLNTITPAFQQAGQSMGQMTGALAFLTRRMPSVRMSSVALARSMQVLSEHKFEKVFTKLGDPITKANGKLKDLVTVIGIIRKHFPGVVSGKTSIQDFLSNLTGNRGTIQAQRGLHYLITQYGEYSRMVKQVNRDHGEFTKSFKALNDTAANKWAVQLNKMKEAWLNLGQAALPPLTQILKMLTAAAGELERFNNFTGGKAAEIFAWGAAIMVGVGILGKLVGALGEAITSLKLFALARAMANAAGVGGGAGSTVFVPGEAAAGGGLALAGVAGLAALGVGAGAALWYTSTLPSYKAKTNAQRLQAMKSYNQAQLGPAAPGMWQPRGANNVINRKIQADQATSALGFDPKKIAHDYRVAAAAVGQFDKVMDHNPGARRNAAMIALRNSIMNTEDAMLHLGGEASNFVNNLSRNMSRPLSITQIYNHLKEIPKVIRPAVLAISKITGKDVNQRGINFLMGHQKIMPGFTAFISQFKKLPSTKQLKILMNNREIDSRIAEFIRKFHKLPSTKQIKIMYKDNAAQARRTVQKTLKAAALHHLPAGATNTTPVVHQAAIIKRAMSSFKNITRTIHFKYNPNNPIANSKATRKGITTALTGIKAGPIDLSAIEQSFATAIQEANTTGASIGAALVAGARSKKGLDMNSPSKKFIKVAHEVIEGIQVGLVKQAGGAAAAMKTVTDTMLSTFQNFHDEMAASFGDLFSGPLGQSTNMLGMPTSLLQQQLTYGTGINGKGLISDLQKQVSAFAGYRRQLNNLRSRGAPEGLVQQLMGMGSDAAPEIAALSKMTQKQLNTYYKLWKRSQKQIHAAASDAMGRQVRLWRDEGKNVAFGFLAGLNEGMPKLRKAMAKIAHDMFHVVRKHNKSHSPSRLYFQEGVNMLEGLQMGMQSFTPQFSYPSGGGRSGGATHTHYHYEPTIYGTPDVAATRMARFDFERHISKRLPR